MHPIRCPVCKRLLGILRGAYRIKCPKCGKTTQGQAGVSP